ncbi:MAG TPA: HyaD/HybD family hydrogenase maturation endopeptidase [Sedimenticola sp.]|nr:HyaD/HybD family hydrogenase maturation endopeptidase [Sedimenticola sp.]
MNSETGHEDFHTLILGIGNLLWADEGFGIRAMEQLHRRYEMPAGVRFLDGGTQGIFLLPWIRVAPRLLIFDAIDFGLEPGSLRVIRDDDVPRYMGAKKVSMHQTGFQEVLATARLLEGNPRRLALVGVQPHTLDDFGGSLTPVVREGVAAAVAAAVGVLEEWGSMPAPRRNPLPDTELTGPGALEQAVYELRPAG